MKLGMYVHIMAHAPNSQVYFINTFLQSICLYVYPLFVGRQQIVKNFTAAANTHTIGELLDALFSMRSVFFKAKCPINSTQNFLFTFVINILF
jgi:hypothetical protein